MLKSLTDIGEMGCKSQILDDLGYHREPTFESEHQNPSERIRAQYLQRLLVRRMGWQPEVINLDNVWVRVEIPIARIEYAILAAF